MKINWFTVIAQVINFIILVWLLKKFLYKPVLDAIDAREKKIVARLEDAKSKREEAKKEQDEFAKKNKQFDEQKKELMDKAIADTSIQKDKLLNEARKEVEALHTKQQKAIADMQENLEKELTQKIQQEVYDISRKALTDLASVDLDEQIANHFISRLAELKETEIKQFKEAFNAGSNLPAGKHAPVLIQSAFELNKKQQTAIKKAADEILNTSTEFEFKTVPEMINGIQLSANGYKLSWNISAFLSSLQNSISTILKDKVAPASNVKKTADKKQEPEKETAHEIK